MTEFKSMVGTKITLENFSEVEKAENVVYNVVLNYDTNSTNHSEIITVTDLDVAMEVMDKAFVKEAHRLMSEYHFNSEDIARLVSDGQYYVCGVDGYLCLGDEYLTAYITVNKLITSI